MNNELFRQMEYSLARQLELLEVVRSGVADVAWSRTQVMEQVEQLQTQADKLGQQAEKALSMGRDDLAQVARARRAEAQGQLADLQRTHTRLQTQEDKLMQDSSELEASTDAFLARVEEVRGTPGASAEPADAESELAGRFRMLRELWEEGLLSKEQYDKKRVEVAKSLS